MEHVCEPTAVSNAGYRRDIDEAPTLVATRHRDPNRDFLSLAARFHGFSSAQEMVCHSKDIELDRVPLMPHHRNQKDFPINEMQSTSLRSHRKRHHFTVEVIA